MDDCELLLGRPFGGCGILYRKSIAPIILTVLNVSCAVTLNAYSIDSNTTLCTLLLNVYLPTDYGWIQCCFSRLSLWARWIYFDNILICGDFTVDFSRHVHNTARLIDGHNIVSTDTSSHIQFTYRKDDHSVFSWPDHILTLRHNVSQVQEVTCLDSADNFSDHLPNFFSTSLFKLHCQYMGEMVHMLVSSSVFFSSWLVQSHCSACSKFM